jgi:hypothetical protein
MDEDSWLSDFRCDTQVATTRKAEGFGRDLSIHLAAENMTVLTNQLHAGLA